MERQPNPDDPAYRDQSTRRRLEEKKSKTPGEQLEEEGDYLDTGELDQEGKPLLSEKVGPDDIILEGLEEEKAKHGERDKAIQAAGKAKRKGYLTDEDYLDRLKDAARIPLNTIRSRLEKPIEFGSNVWQDTKEWAPWYDLGGQVGALGARGIESYLTVDADNFQEFSFELLQKTLDYRKGVAGSIIGEIPIVKENLTRLGNTLNRLKKQWQPVQNLDGTLSIVDDSIDDLAKQSAQPLMSKGSGGGSTSFVKRPNFGSAEEALTAGYGGKSFERLMKSKRHLKLYGDSAEEAAAFMQRGWNHFAVNKTLRGMEGGRYITLSNGQVLKLKTNTAASKINVEKMTGLSLKNDLAQEAYRLKRNLGTQFDIPKLQAFADKAGYPPEAVTAYIKAAKEHNKKIDELVKYLNKKGGSVMWSKGHYRAVENLIQMGTGDKASADMITNVFLQKLSPNARMQAKHDLPHLLNLASNRAASVEEDFLKFVEPELFGSFWPKLTGKYKTVFIDRVLEDMQKASGKGIDIRDIIEENVNLILEDTNLIETMGRIKFNANKVYPWLQKHGVNIKANFNVK